jgi:hypothetical protein
MLIVIRFERFDASGQGLEQFQPVDGYRLTALVGF